MLFMEVAALKRVVKIITNFTLVTMGTKSFSSWNFISSRNNWQFVINTANIQFTMRLHHSLALVCHWTIIHHTNHYWPALVYHWNTIHHSNHHWVYTIHHSNHHWVYHIPWAFTTDQHWSTIEALFTTQTTIDIYH